MTDKKSDRLGTIVFTIANELVNHFGKKLDRPVIDDITRNLTLEMCGAPTAWAFSGKDEQGKPIFDEAKEMKQFREWRRKNTRPECNYDPSRELIMSEAWLARAKAGEVGHE